MCSLATECSCKRHTDKLQNAYVKMAHETARLCVTYLDAADTSVQEDSKVSALIHLASMASTRMHQQAAKKIGKKAASTDVAHL